MLDLPGAVAADGVDAPVAAHYGSFNVEQRTLAGGEGFVDLSHRDIVRVGGPDRLTWLHSLTSQYFEGLAPAVWTTALILSPQGHIEHWFTGTDDGSSFTAWTEPGRGAALAEFLERMRFWSDVTVSLVDDLACVWRPALVGRVASEASRPVGRVASEASRPVGRVASEASVSRPLETTGQTLFVPRDQLPVFAEAAGPACGLWAYEALRIERGEPRFGLDTDHRTIPNEIGLVGTHLDKGCYRGQETVARVHTLGRPPRRLVMLHLDGSENRLPAVGAPVLDGDREVGFVGSSARHFELGPIALGLVKRSVPVDAQLVADGMPAGQEVVVDPEVGLHVRPLR